MSYINRGFGDYEGAQAEPYFPFTPVAPPASGGCGCGGGCGGHGMGYFTSMDPSTWGVAEWGTVAAGLFVGSKVIGSHPAVRSGGKRARAAASKGTESLGNIALLGAAAYAAWYFWNQYQTTGSLGLGDYQAQGYVTPQLLMDPVNSSDIRIPAGW